MTEKLELPDHTGLHRIPVLSPKVHSNFQFPSHSGILAQLPWMKTLWSQMAEW